MNAPALSYGLSFHDLYDRDGLSRLDAAFVAWLKDADVEVHARLMAARTAPDKLTVKDEANLLIQLARPFEDFVGALFGVSAEAGALRAVHVKLAPGASVEPLPWVQDDGRSALRLSARLEMVRATPPVLVITTL